MLSMSQYQSLDDPRRTAELPPADEPDEPHPLGEQRALTSGPAPRAPAPVAFAGRADITPAGRQQLAASGDEPAFVRVFEFDDTSSPTRVASPSPAMSRRSGGAGSGRSRPSSRSTSRHWASRRPAWRHSVKLAFSRPTLATACGNGAAMGKAARSAHHPAS